MTRRKKFLILLIPILLMLSAGAYWGRAWLRGSVIPAYVNVTYRPFFKHRFSSSFTPVNNLLKDMSAYSGIDPKAEDGTGDGPPCSFVSYTGFKETVMCQHVQDTNGIIPTSDFVSNWKFGSPNLETYLLTHGWQKEDKQSIAALFDNPREARWINYSKGKDASNCHLYLHYEGRPKPTTALSGDNKFYVNESCIRWIQFIGVFYF